MDDPYVCIELSDMVQTTASPFPRASTPVPIATEPSSAENTAADDATLRQYAAAIVDIKAMRTNVLTIWREEISMMLPEIQDIPGRDGVMAQGAAAVFGITFTHSQLVRGASACTSRADIIDPAYVKPNSHNFD